MNTDVVVIEGVSKRYGPTQALDGVSLSLAPGEVHALMGENGAGKSTLGKVLAGLVRPDSGRVMVEGRVLRPGSIHDAALAGVRIVHQELAQCPHLTVAENLCLHALPTGPKGWVDRRAMRQRAERLVRDLEPTVDVSSPLGALSPGHRQIVQIASALDDHSAGGRARVIVLDEPTSSLSLAETQRLLTIVRDLAQAGICVVYVSHRMGEIFECADRVTVLRDGRFIATAVTREIDEPWLVERMIGRRIDSEGVAGTPPSVGDVVLRVAGVSSPGVLRDISLEVRAGEVVGLGGLVGAGRSELLDAIFGLDPRARGRIEACGIPLPPTGAGARLRAGVGYVPEDRKLQGLFFQLGIGENLTIQRLNWMSNRGVRRRRAEHRAVAERIEDFHVKCASAADGPGTLSGGNQQKVLIARWMGKESRVLLLDEPTRGIDVGTKDEIHRQVRAAASRGAGVLVASSEMSELLAISDRIIVLSDGQVTGELAGVERTQANVLRLATRSA